mgnify:CR=1 FL=1
MKLFQQLLIAPAAIGLLAPLSATASEVNLDAISNYSEENFYFELQPFNSCSAENHEFQRQDVHENTKNSTFVNPPLQPFLGMYPNGPKKLYCSDDK